MRKIKRVYICDVCDAVELPRIRLSPCGMTHKTLPSGWEGVGSFHLCPACYEAFRQTIIKNREVNDDV